MAWRRSPSTKMSWKPQKGGSNTKSLFLRLHSMYLSSRAARAEMSSGVMGGRGFLKRRESKAKGSIFKT